jgi:hypothetical protein
VYVNSQAHKTEYTAKLSGRATGIVYGYLIKADGSRGAPIPAFLSGTPNAPKIRFYGSTGNCMVLWTYAVNLYKEHGFGFIVVHPMCLTRILEMMTPAFGVSVTPPEYADGKHGAATNGHSGRAKSYETLADAVAEAAASALESGLEGHEAALEVRAKVISKGNEAFTGELKAYDGGGGLAVLDALIVAVARLPRP